MHQPDAHARFFPRLKPKNLHHSHPFSPIFFGHKSCNPFPRQSLSPQNLSKPKPPPVFRSQISSDCFTQIMDQCELQQTFEIVSTPAPRLKQSQHGDAVRMVGHGLNMAQSKLLLPTSARLQLQSFEQLPEIL